MAGGLIVLLLVNPWSLELIRMSAAWRLRISLAAMAMLTKFPVVAMREPGVVCGPPVLSR